MLVLSYWKLRINEHINVTVLFSDGKIVLINSLLHIVKGNEGFHTVHFIFFKNNTIARTIDNWNSAIYMPT